MMWQNWTNIVLGIALVGIAFVGLSEVTLVWTLSVIGIMIVTLELWEASLISEMTTKKLE